LAELADLLVEKTDRYLEQTTDLSADHNVRFFGETTVSLAAQTGILLGEYVVHWHDLAMRRGDHGNTDPSHTRLVVGAIAALMPRYLDREAARESPSPTTHTFPAPQVRLPRRSRQGRRRARLGSPYGLPDLRRPRSLPLGGLWPTRSVAAPGYSIPKLRPSSSPPAARFFNTAFTKGQFGYACAMGWFWH
jgi:hypothetical protein